MGRGAKVQNSTRVRCSALAQRDVIAVGIGRLDWTGLDWTYHGALSELSDLLDCSWSSLLEGYAVDLIAENCISVFRPKCCICGSSCV